METFSNFNFMAELLAAAAITCYELLETSGGVLVSLCWAHGQVRPGRRPDGSRSALMDGPPSAFLNDCFSNAGGVLWWQDNWS